TDVGYSEEHGHSTVVTAETDTVGIYRYNADYNPLEIIVSIERDREVDPHYSTDRDQEGDPECSRDQNCEGEPHFCTCQDREVNSHSPDGSGQHSEDQDRESYQKYFMDQDLEADLDRGADCSVAITLQVEIDYV
ncbi:hypothetical protein ABG067_008779, partial [Albugo candida]